jgi:hypothetical protein
MKSRPTSSIVAVFVLAATWAAVPGAQTVFPRFNSQGAKAHVGERAMVCGQVVETSCQRGDDVLLTLAPGSDPAPFRIRIPASSVEALGRGVPHRYDDRIVCAIGTIEQRTPATKWSHASRRPLLSLPN